MPDDAEDNSATGPKPDTSFEQSHKETRRAQWVLNILVVFSAVAGSLFFFYVLYTIQLFGGKDAPPVNLPTSSAGAKLGLLVGEDAGTGLNVVLRDVDEAPEYREKLSEVMRKDAGISAPGRLYLLIIRNDGKAAASVNATRFSVRDGGGKQWMVQWLEQAAKPEAATPMGKLRLGQSSHNFDLATGAERQLYVFIPAAGDASPPPAEELVTGTLTIAGGPEISLTHTELKAALQ
ncbi:MAG: hypothetical protein H6839_07670 [Planctomycetes bacterium]|nr:hypothetical protein [Planctomycetota bacterium]